CSPVSSLTTPSYLPVSEEGSTFCAGFDEPWPKAEMAANKIAAQNSAALNVDLIESFICVFLSPSKRSRSRARFRLVLQCGLRLGCEFSKRFRLFRCKVRKDLSIEFDPGEFQSMHEL